MNGEGGRGSWLRRDKSVASPLWRMKGTLRGLRRVGSNGCVAMGWFFERSCELAG